VNIGSNPELLDKLCASYALGTLKGGARRRLERYARQSATIRTSLLLWQERMVAMTELVWPSIERKVRTETINNTGQFSALTDVAEKLLRATLHRWRSIAMVGGLATAASVLLGWQQYHQVKQANAQLVAAASVAPKLRYVAVLADEKSNANILITVDSKNNQIAVQRVSQFKEADEKSLQLWSIPRVGAPTSLSVLDADKLIRLKVSNTLLDNAEVLAVSLEAKGGVPNEKGPVGPVIFKGQLLQATM
jgi:anti-sigma-K factor RskA